MPWSASAIWWLSPLQPTEIAGRHDHGDLRHSPSNVGLGQQDPARKPGSPAASPPPSTEPSREPEQQQALAPAQPQQTASQHSHRSPPRPCRSPSRCRRCRSTNSPCRRYPSLRRRRPRTTSPSRPPPAPPRPAQRTQPLPPRPAPPAQQRPAGRRVGVDARAAARRRSGGPDGGTRTDAQRLPVARVSASSDAIASIQQRAVSNHQAVGRDAGHRNAHGRLDRRPDRHVQRLVPPLTQPKLEAIRKAAPFPPVPNDMPGEPVILILPGCNFH